MKRRTQKVVCVTVVCALTSFCFAAMEFDESDVASSIVVSLTDSLDVFVYGRGKVAVE